MHLDQKPAGGVAQQLAVTPIGEVDGLNAPNACGLAEEDLKQRIIDNIDIGAEKARMLNSQGGCALMGSRLVELGMD